MAGGTEPAGRRLADELHEGWVVGSGRGGEYTVETPVGPLLSRLRGRIKLATGTRVDQLVVGDRVRVRQSLDEPDRAVIEAVLPRASQLTRGRPGKAPQTIAANVDQVIIVVAVFEPMFSLHTIDRYLAIAASTDLAPVIVLNKVDFDAEGEIQEIVRAIYEPLGYPLLTTSTVTEEGLAEFDAQLAGRISVVVGPSGAGKSSLLNTVNPAYELRTGEVMDIGKGRHTTTESRLLPLDHGGYVADTPGIKTLQLADGSVAPRDLQHLFPELDPLVGQCRFADCTHRSEPDCAVQEAVDEGEIAASRYDSYCILYDELAAARPW